MMRQIGIFHEVRFSFNCNAAYFKRHFGENTLAEEWQEQWNECARGRSDGMVLDILWCPWMIPE